MALIKCTECGKDVSDEAKTCPHCGVAIKHKGSALFWVFVVFFVLVVGVLSLGAGKSDPVKTQARQAYDLCMDDLASADRARNGTSAFIAGTCERLRGEFKQKYGTSP